MCFSLMSQIVKTDVIHHHLLLHKTFSYLLTDEADSILWFFSHWLAHLFKSQTLSLIFVDLLKRLLRFLTNVDDSLYNIHKTEPKNFL